MRIASTLDLEELKNAKILEINRRARYLIINFDNKKSLIIHLGMSGKITLQHQFNKFKISFRRHPGSINTPYCNSDKASPQNQANYQEPRPKFLTY